MADSTYGILFILIYCFTVIEGEIRCYCNESGCVSTGYMCKSSMGTCYSLVTYHRDILDAVHGCADSLSEVRKSICSANVPMETREDAGLGTRAIRANEPIVLCCTEDMCNYREHLDISVVIDTQSNDSTDGGDHGAPGSTLENKSLSNTSVNKNPEKDLWFKAAVIAVPIAGGFILILLVLLAVRMLRTDSRHHRRLIQIRRERSLTKAQLYVTDHFNDKIDTSKSMYSCKAHGPHREPKVRLDRDGNKYEQVCCLEKHGEHPPRPTSGKQATQPSLILWGKPRTCNEPATLV